MDEDAIVALFTTLVRAGAIDDDLIREAADDCDAAEKPMAAHQLRCILLSAMSPSPVERAEAMRRSGIRVIEGGNSG
jgi:hypothetical protein